MCAANVQCFMTVASMRPTSRASRRPVTGAPARTAARRPHLVTIVPWCAQPMVKRTAARATPASPSAHRCAPADVDLSNPPPLRSPHLPSLDYVMPCHAMPHHAMPMANTIQPRTTAGADRLAPACRRAMVRRYHDSIPTPNIHIQIVHMATWTRLAIVGLCCTIAHAVNACTCTNGGV